MKVYLIRHGQDDDTVRGGWSDSPLTDLGIQQSIDLADKILKNFNDYNICKIFSSDIPRAKQTAIIIAEKLNLPVDYITDLREVNNGDLAGMNNAVAEEKYPNLYWRNLEWEEHYPNGERPKEFYERVSNAWSELINSLADYDKNILVVTHGGVINIIRCIVAGVEYSNKNKYQGIASGEIALEIQL